MQAIVTKYHPWTNRRPARISAQLASGSHKVMISAPIISEGVQASHSLAVKTLLERKLAWQGKWIAGETPTGFVYVCQKWNCRLSLPK